MLSVYTEILKLLPKLKGYWFQHVTYAHVVQLRGRLIGLDLKICMKMETRKNKRGQDVLTNIALIYNN